MRGARVLVAVLLLVSAVSAVAVAQEEGIVVGRPNLDLSVPDDRVAGGERTTLELYVSNDGDLDRGGPEQFTERVTTARNVRLRVQEEAFNETLAGGLDVLNEEIVAGSVPEGVSGPFPLEVEVDDSLPPGTYEIPVEVSYDYTNWIRFSDVDAPEYGDGSREVRGTITLVVEDRPRFEVVPAANRTIPAGDSGTVRFAVTNTGTQAATDATVLLSAANSSLFFGGGDERTERTGVFVPSLAPGETRFVDVEVGTDRETAPGTYPVDARVRYRAPSGVTETLDAPGFGVAVAGEQTFAIRSVTDDLRVGDAGNVSGRVVNTGNGTVRNAVVVYRTENPNLTPRETEYAVGRLAPGESARFAFAVDVSNATEPGPRVLEFATRYRNPSGEIRTSAPIDARVSVGDEQAFGLRTLSGDLRVGETGTVDGRVVNTGDRTVQDAVVVYRSTNPDLRPRTTEYAVGDLAPGEAAPFSFTFDVDAGSDPGPRSLSFAVRHRTATDALRVSDALDGRVAVGGERTFGVRAVSDELRVGEGGLVRGRLVNAGNEPVRNAVVLFRPANTTLTPREAEYAVGDLAPGEAVPFSFRVDVPPEAEPGPRQVAVAVRYRDGAGEVRTSEDVDVRVSVGGEQTFAVRDATANLSVGDDGDVSGELVNTGGATVSSAVVVYRSESPSLTPRETEYAVGALDPGEAAPFTFRVDVGEEAEPGPRIVEYVVRYRNEAGDRLTSDVVDARVDVGAETDEFRVEPVDAALEAGSSRTVAFRVTNAANETLTNVEAKLFADDPLASSNDEAFVTRLEPGASARLKFNVNVERSAIPKLYPASIDFSYEDERGDTALSDTYRVPVRVTPPDRGSPLVPGAILIGALAVALGIAWWKRGAIRRLF